jgi:hypothetical protein
MTTSKIGDVETLLTEDRGRPGTYVRIVEFSSYEEAIAYSDMPETSEYAEPIAALCDGPSTFRNWTAARVEALD